MIQDKRWQADITKQVKAKIIAEREHNAKRATEMKNA
jgi:hypothetical protein